MSYISKQAEAISSVKSVLARHHTWTGLQQHNTLMKETKLNVKFTGSIFLGSLEIDDIPVLTM